MNEPIEIQVTYLVTVGVSLQLTAGSSRVEQLDIIAINPVSTTKALIDPAPAILH